MSKFYTIIIFDGGLVTKKSDPVGMDREDLTITQIREAYKRANQEAKLGLSIPTREEILPHMEAGTNENIIFEQLCHQSNLLQGEQKPVSQQLFNYYKRLEDERVNELLELAPHALPLLKKLAEKESTTMVVGFRDPTLMRFVLTNLLAEHGGIEQYIDHVIETTSDFPYRLPDPSIWNDLIKKRYPQITEKNTLAIVKESVDIIAARKFGQFGIHTIWLRWRGGDMGRCLDVPPQQTAYSLKLLLKHIDQFASRLTQDY